MGNVIIFSVAHALWEAMRWLFCSPRLGLATIAKKSSDVAPEQLREGVLSTKIGFQLCYRGSWSPITKLGQHLLKL